MRLDELGEKRGVIFALIPDNDTSYNFIIGMLYTQLFQQLYRSADFNSVFSTTADIYSHLDYSAKVASSIALENGLPLPNRDFKTSWEGSNSDQCVPKNSQCVPKISELTG